MTIQTKVTLHCDIGLKCTKQIVKTLEGSHAARTIRVWAKDAGWGSWGQRDACPECWKALHSVTTPEQRDIDEDVQSAIDGERGG